MSDLLERIWQEEVDKLKQEVAKSSKETDEATNNAKYVVPLRQFLHILTVLTSRMVSAELAWLRRMMREYGRSSESENSTDGDGPGSSS